MLYYMDSNGPMYNVLFQVFCYRVFLVFVLGVGGLVMHALYCIRLYYRLMGI